MAKKRSDYLPEEISFPDQVITTSELVNEMKTSYIEYAMSVIVGRALPDVRDGLKPVHRRILYAMYEDGLTRDKPFKKCATAVGAVLGAYHPHGDASVYDALVRMGQDFSMRYPLIDKHGNFGSIDGDPPAAYRYTEARMARIADEMLRDIEKDTVDWDPNFDESRKEPRVLPSRFPNLLVNGSSGIAVGMATNIPPHNLSEVIDAVVCVLDNPDATLEDLMEHIKGPDFPTRGLIMGKSGIRAAYATGRGRVTVRARTEFEDFSHDRVRIIVTELPYQVNKRQLIKNIADMVNDKRIEGISDLRDETDNKGMRIVIELKKGANQQVVLNTLFLQTQMQVTFPVNMLALVNNQTQPKILSLRHILDEYIAFQKDLIIRRTRCELRKAAERAHLLEGLLIAQANIDEVIRIIRNSYDNARERLMERFSLSEVQANAILEMRLKALQGLEEEKLRAEYEEIEKRIAYLNTILESEEVLIGVFKKEILEIKEKYGDERRTEICEVEDEIDIEDLIERHTCVVTLSHAGYIKRIPADTYSAQHRGGKGVIGMTTKEDDFVEKVVTVNSHSNLFFFTTKGRVMSKKAYYIPEAGRTAKGNNVVNLFELEEGERINAIIPIDSFEEEDYLTMVTKRGIIKRTPIGEYEYQRKGGKRAITLDEGDELVFVARTTGKDDVLVATKKGFAVRFEEVKGRSVGRTARGVIAIRLTDGDEVAGAAVVDNDKTLLFITEKGFGKRTKFDQFPVHNRGGKGVICHKISEKTGLIADIAPVSDDDDIMLITNEGTVIRTPASGISLYSRAAAGVIIMRLGEGCGISNFAVVEKEEEVPGEEDGSAETEETETAAPVGNSDFGAETNENQN